MKQRSMEECIFPDETVREEDIQQLQKLLAIKQVEQRTPEWYRMRKNMITASDWATALNKNKYSTKEELINKKCNIGKKFTGNEYTIWGQKYEPIATRIYELNNKVKVHEFGVLAHPKYSFLGASPDGISTKGIMLEIKCPFRRKINGTIPTHYWIQIQGQLEVCDLSSCDYLECEIQEYFTLQEYFRDQQLYKGIIVTYKKDNEFTYEYSPFNINKEEYKRWYNTLSHENVYDILGWRIVHMNCLRIRRDKEWFEKNLHALQQVWEEIQEKKKEEQPPQEEVQEEEEKPILVSSKQEEQIMSQYIKKIEEKEREHMKEQAMEKIIKILLESLKNTPQQEKCDSYIIKYIEKKMKKIKNESLESLLKETQIHLQTIHL